MRLAGYAAIFDAPDRGGDIVRKGAFARAAKAGLPLLWQHDTARRIGFVESLSEDERGLRVIAQIAIWIGGGWRYCVPVDGMRVRMVSQATDRVRSGGTWITTAQIPNPASGAVVDVEARAAIVSLLAYLRAIGHVKS